MNRRLILVPPKALWETASSELARWLDEGSLEPTLVIAPTRTTARRLIAQASERRGASAGLRAATWHDLARERAPYTSDLTPLPPAGDAIVIADLLRRDPGPWVDLAEQTGFHRALAATVRDLADAGVNRLTSPPSPPDVARLFNAFQDHLDEHHLLDDARTYRAAATAARTQPLQASRILVHAIYDLTGIQAELVHSLFSSGQTDVIWVAPDPELNGGQFAAPLMSWLASELSFAVQRPAVAPSRGLAALADQLDRHQPSTDALEPGIGFRVLACPGHQAQLDEIARSILAAAAAGLAWRDMAVVTPTSEMLPELARRLERCGIPSSGAPDPSLADDPAGRAITTLLDLVDGATDRRTVIRLLTTAPIRSDRLGDKAEPSRWDVLTRLAGCTGGDAASWHRSLEAARDTLARQAIRATTEPQDNVSDQQDGWAFVRSRDALEGDARQLRILAGVIDDLLENCARCARSLDHGGWSEAVTTLVQLLKHWLEPTETVLAVQEAITSVTAYDRIGVRPDRATLRRQIAEAIETAAAPPGAASRGAGHRPGAAVLLTSWQGARGLRLRAAWLVDLASGTFPPTLRQDPILPDRLRHQIAQHSGCPLPIKLRRAAEAELQLRLGIAVPSDQLTISFVHSDPLTGRTQLPAHAVVECLRLAEGRQVSYTQLDESRFVETIRSRQPRLEPDSSRPLLDLAEYDLAAALSDPTGAAAHLLLDHRWRRQLRCDRARYGSPKLSEWDGLVSPRHRIGTVWVTTLEELATCPFRFFLRTALGLTPAPDPEEAFLPDRRDVGMVAHKVVEALMRRWQRSDGSLPASLTTAMIHEIIDEVHTRGAFQADELRTGAPAMWIVAMDQLARDLTTTLATELATIASSGWRDRRMEVPHEQDVTFGTINLHLRGRPDRVDRTTEDTLVITDYKYAKGSPATVKLQGGQRLQLPFYARLMANYFGATVDAARYVYLRADARRPETRITVDQLAELEPSLTELIEELVALVREGRLFQYPENDRRRCQWCDFADLCGPGVRAVFRRKQPHDPNLEQHATLTERFP